jgi:hypothetical protein
VKRREGFNLRRPNVEARARQVEARVTAMTAEVERLRQGSSLFRRLVCLLAGHRYWRSGLAGRAPDGTVYSLHVCRRCGRRAAEVGEAIRPGVLS